MAKKHEAEHQSAEAGGLRWLLTYADLVTLLLACFVVLFATREAPSPKTIAIIQQAAREVFGPIPGGDSAGTENPFEGSPGVLDAIGPALKGEAKKKIDVTLPHPPVPPEVLEGEKGETKTDGKFVCPKEATCEFLPTGTVVNVPGDMLFDSGSSHLRPEARRSLNQIGEQLQFNRETLRFEGHTDSDPISTAAFPSNWELSAARAAAVAKYFMATFNYDSRKVAIAGYAEFHPYRCSYDISPKACNKTPAQKQHNRRVVITITKEAREAANLPASDVQKGRNEESKPLPEVKEHTQETSHSETGMEDSEVPAGTINLPEP